MSEYIKRGIKGTAIITAFTILGSIFGYFTRLFLARKLTAVEFGLFYSVFTLFMFVSVFTEMGYNSALTKFIPEFLVKGEKRKLITSIKYSFIITLLLSILASAILFSLKEMLSASYFRNTEAIPLIIIFLPVLVFNAIPLVFHSFFQGMQDMFKYGLLYFMGKFAFFAFCIILFFTGIRGVALPAWAFLVSVILPIILFSPAFFSRIKEIGRGLNLKKKFDRLLFKKITFFAIPNFLTTIAGTVIGYIDTLVLTFFVPLGEVGVYNAVLPTVLILGYLGTAMNTVFFPLVSELWARKEKDSLKRALSLMYKYLLVIMIPLSLAMIFFAREILQIFFGESFLPGVLPLRILSVGVVFLTLAQINFSALNGIGKPVMVTKITIAAAIANAIGNIIIIPYLGMSGAAIVTTVSYLIMLVCSTVAIRKKIPFRQEKLWRILFASTIFFASLSLSQKALGLGTYFELLSLLAIGSSVYIVCLLGLKLITLDEIRFFLKEKKEG